VADFCYNVEINIHYMDTGFGIIILLVVLSGIFSASEIALTALTKAKVLALKEDGKFASLAIHRLKKTPQRVLVSILVGNQTVNILATFLSTIWAIQLLGEDRVNWLIIPFTLVLVVFGTILPKTFALGFPEQFSRIAAYPLLLFVTLMRPVIFFFELIINGVSHLFNIDRNQLSTTSGREIEALIEIGASEGVIEEGQDIFLKHVLRFGESQVKEVMIPLKDIAAIELNVEREALSEFLNQNHHPEYPVYDDDINAIKGHISFYNLLELLRRSRKKYPLVGERLLQPVVVPKTATFVQLFKVLRDKNRRTAMVIDEFGQTVGMVTMAGIMEEITGVEMEQKKVQPIIKKIDRNLWEADGQVRVAQLNESLKLNIPYPDHKVLSLLLLEELKRFPKTDEVLRIEGIEIRVKRIEKNVVKKLEISKTRRSTKKSSQ